MMKKLLLICCLLMTVMGMQAQKLTVEKMEVAAMDLSASTQPHLDKNGNPCGLVKVQLAAAGAQFEGNVLGDVAYKTGEYWVYMSAGSYMLNVKHPNFLPLFVNFRDYGIQKVESKTTYVLTLVMPQGNAPVQKQKLTINYSPASAMVIIDSKPYQGNGRVEVELPVGSHDYQIVAIGYTTAEGSVKLSADNPRIINETLMANASEQVQQTQVGHQPQTQTGHQPQTQAGQQPQTQAAADEFEGLTASRIKSIADDYYYGSNGKTKDYAEAVRWYRKAAEQGEADAQSRLGTCYFNGYGVTEDHAEALRWFRKAAEQGHAGGQNNLGVFYYNGFGVAQNKEKARELWRKAAAQGEQNAKNNLKKLFGESFDNPFAELFGIPFAESSGAAIETFTVNGVSFNMVRVDGGTFQMGATSEMGSDASDLEKPVHQVTLSTYSIGETEVTQALWQAVMGSNPSNWKGGNLPVEQVSWNDCQTFIQKLNQLTGKRFRLPTEAEWEYAARGGNKSRGYKYSGSNTIDDVAWYDGNSSNKTHPVKTKQANELGLYDMSGNVWEWCQDWYGSYSSSAQTNPTGPSSASYRVYRGGSWFNSARYCRVSDRGGFTPANRSGDLGLRLAL